MSCQQTTAIPNDQQVAFAFQFDEVDKALFEYRSRKQHAGFPQQQHFNNQSANGLKYKNGNNRNNYHHNHSHHHQKSNNYYYNNNNMNYKYGNDVHGQNMRPQAMFNTAPTTSPTLYQPTSNVNGSYFANTSPVVSKGFGEYEETGFLPLNSKLVDSQMGVAQMNNLSSSVSSGSVSSYSSYNDSADFIPGNMLAGGPPSLVSSASSSNTHGFGFGVNSDFAGSGSGSGSGFFGSGAGSGSGLGAGEGYFNELNIGVQHKEKSFGFLNIWGNDMSVWG
ncbi:hypothetical protein WICPIJ_009138 [Wickerhamomyces pijperi]|uniref:Uncharacterized protein n=1 Tax=Wickerhamomyces pijperi TaxID=599730 RepID=A0A9P8PQA0_WICPI|nr:hypothetical protein WICPIJ_009138 [Wickerhamomyces pijperi]